MSSSETDQIDWPNDLTRRIDIRSVSHRQPAFAARLRRQSRCFGTRVFQRRSVSCSRDALRLLRARHTRSCIGGRVDDAQTKARLDVMRIEHRDLDDAIAALALASTRDQLQMARLKKRKLRIRDEIAALEDLLIPDIIA